MRMGMGFDVFRRAPGEYVPPDVGTIEAFDSNGDPIDPVIHDGCKYWVFTDDSGTLTVQGNPTVDILLVGGGGGGGRYSNSAGGGGAGGVLFLETHQLTKETYGVAVGAGGAKTSSVGQGNDGSDSYLAEPDGENLLAIDGAIAYGGGGGGAYVTVVTLNGRSGGSGGGGGARYSATESGVVLGGSGIEAQGHAGGKGYYGNSSGLLRSGGGGGAKSAGIDAGSSPGAEGGGYTLDELFDIDDSGLTSKLIYESILPQGFPGVGKGGAGGNNSNAKEGSSGQALTGNGGGGSAGAYEGGAGGSGIVIIRMEVAE